MAGVDPGLGERLASRITDLLADVELDLLRRLRDALLAAEAAGELDTLVGQQAALLRVQALALELRRGVRGVDAALLAQVQDVVAQAYNLGQASAVGDLDDAGIDPTPAPDAQRATTAAAAEAADRIREATQVLPDLLTRTYREAVAAAAGEVLGGDVTRRAASQHVLDRLGAQGITGFTDRRGRNWSLTAYAEMAVRTATGQAAVQGHVDVLAASGIDLVLVSDAPRECPLCRPWEGKVLSLSGAVGEVITRSATSDDSVRVSVAGTLRQARSAGFQHPNCRHSVSAFIPGATVRRQARSEAAGYDAVQRQRAMERKVREWKRRQALALDGQTAAMAANKVRTWQAALREHVDANDLKRLYGREQVGEPGPPRAT